MKTVRFATLFLFSFVLLSCTKESTITEQGWNVITFSEEGSTSYSEQLDKAHINFTFPNQLSEGVISIENGRWSSPEGEFVLVAHNWTGEHFLFRVKSGESTVFEQLITDWEAVTFTIELERGVYSFEGLIESRSVFKKLFAIALHGSNNRLEVK